MFLARLDEIAQEKCHLRRDYPIVVGVSGGADSLALLYGLHSLGFTLIVAHLDHALRDESGAEATYVQSIAEALGLPFVTARVDVHQAAAEKGQSVEEAAREVRYQFLFEQACQLNAQAVATAHHADDQVETVLMHFLRGAALTGLSGMAYRTVIPGWDATIPVVRPLLDHWREDIDQYVAALDLTPVVDQSNTDQTYFRNRLRHVLIPELEAYNPRFKDALQRMALVLGGENSYLETLAEEAWQTCLNELLEDRVVLALGSFQGLPTALQRRVLRRGVAHLQPDLRDVGFEVIERGLAFVENPSQSGEIDWISRLNLVVLRESLIIKTWQSDLPEYSMPLLPTKDFEKEIIPGSSLSLKNGWLLAVESLPLQTAQTSMEAAKQSPGTVWLDADRLEFPLRVRSRRAGERWKPLGLGGHSQKISDFLINEKVPAHLRDFWPLVCSGDQIAWVVGLRPAESFKITGDTTSIIKLEIRQCSQINKKSQKQSGFLW